jgi:hypothetical protein
MPEFDVFISYSWKDNSLVEPWAAAREDRWVRCFKFALQERLNYKLGLINQPPATIFLDAKDMDAGDNFDAEILQALDNTRVFLPLISPWYVHTTTPYCKLEREYFIDKVLGPNAPTLGRIVGVLIDGAEGLKIWKEHFFAEVLAFPFFEKVIDSESMVRLGNNGVGKSFLDRIDTLAENLCKRIIDLRGTAVAPAPQVPEKGRVFFAAVPGHLEQQRTELVKALFADGWTVFPQENECPADISICEQWVTDTIAQQKIQAYVQILDAYPWKPSLHDAAQFRGATKAPGIERMVYRLAEVDLTLVTNKEHLAWLSTLSSKSVPQLRVDLPAALQQMLVLRREAERSIAKQIAQQAAPPTTVFITVSAADDDEPLAGMEIANLATLDAYGSIGSKAGEGLEESFDEIDGLLTVYGNEDYTLRVTSVLKSWRTILAKRRLPRTQAPPFGILVLPPPPGDKDFCLNKFIVPRMHRIPHGDAAAMQTYLDDVRAFVDTKRQQGVAA